MPDLVLILSEHGEYVDVYGSSEDLLYSSMKEMKGQNVNDILADKDAKPIMAVIDKTLATNEIQVFEYELDVKKGHVVFEGRIAPVENYQSKDTSSRHVLWVDAMPPHLSRGGKNWLLSQQRFPCVERGGR